MKKYLPVGIKSTFLLSVFFWAFILSTSSAKAEDTVCCKIDHIQNFGYTEYKDLLEAECNGKNSNDPKVTATPYKGKKVGRAPGASTDSCIDKPASTTDSLGSSLPKFTNPLGNPVLSVRLPGFAGFSKIECKEVDGAQECTIPWIAEYLTALYKYGIAAIIIFAVIVMMIGGVVWLTSAGNEQRVSDAKNWISGSLFGILIALSSFMILTIINPALTKLSPIKIATTEKQDLDEYEIDVDSPGNRDTTDCPSGVTSIDALATYFTKTKKLAYSQPKRGTCEGDTCYCDCSWFSEHLGRCSNLPEVDGEGTSASLMTNSKKVKITKSDCDNPTLKAGDIIVYRNPANTKGHVITYIGNNKVIECGGGGLSKSALETSGRVTISDWKLRCNGHVLKNKAGAYYIKR
ncbi:MAG: NlpC/P60 family protein [Candidatus Falkowbacteria bacterium]|nr:NlpC/P60 family protein [Candidatus Falkowbacteria bacterium]